MRHSGPFPLAFKSPEQGFGGKNSQIVSQGKPWHIGLGDFSSRLYNTLDNGLSVTGIFASY